MNNTKRFVTIRNCIYQNPKSEKIMNIAKIFSLGCVFIYLVVDAINVFRPSNYLCLHAGLFQLLFKSFRCFSDKILPFVTACRYQAGDFMVLFGFEITESQVFQLPFYFPDTRDDGLEVHISPGFHEQYCVFSPVTKAPVCAYCVICQQA